MRGYFGIGIEHPKTEENIGMLWRSAFNLGASFIFTIGRRYQEQCTDTTKAWKSIPLYNYKNFDEFYGLMPHNCQLIGVEFPHETAKSLISYSHPERGIYLLGAEDNGLTKKALSKCLEIIYIPTKYCINVAATGTVIMYDRISKRVK